MFKKTIISILISCFIFSPVLANAAPLPNSFNVKVEYIYSNGDRMIISWNEGKEKHTLFPVDPINLTTYYKAAELYPATITATQMQVNDISGNTHLFSLDASAGTEQVAPQSTTQAAPQATPKNQSAIGEPQKDDNMTAVVYGLVIALLVIMLVGGISSAGAS